MKLIPDINFTIDDLAIHISGATCDDLIAISNLLKNETTSYFKKELTNFKDSQIELVEHIEKNITSYDNCMAVAKHNGEVIGLMVGTLVEEFKEGKRSRKCGAIDTYTISTNFSDPLIFDNLLLFITNFLKTKGVSDVEIVIESENKTQRNMLKKSVFIEKQIVMVKHI